MVPKDAAALIAQVYPLGILLIAFDIRNVPKFVATANAGTLMLRFLAGLFVASILFGVLAEMIAVQTVSDNTDATGLGAFVIGLAGWLLPISAFLILMGSLLNQIGVLDRMGRRSVNRIMDNPERAKDVIAYLAAHPPGQETGESE